MQYNSREASRTIEQSEVVVCTAIYFQVDNHRLNKKALLRQGSYFKINRSVNLKLVYVALSLDVDGTVVLFPGLRLISLLSS